MYIKFTNIMRIKKLLFKFFFIEKFIFIFIGFNKSVHEGELEVSPFLDVDSTGFVHINDHENLLYFPRSQYLSLQKKNRTALLKPLMKSPSSIKPSQLLSGRSVGKYVPAFSSSSFFRYEVFFLCSLECASASKRIRICVASFM